MAKAIKKTETKEIKTVPVDNKSKFPETLPLSTEINGVMLENVNVRIKYWKNAESGKWYFKMYVGDTDNNVFDVYARSTGDGVHARTSIEQFQFHPKGADKKVTIA